MQDGFYPYFVDIISYSVGFFINGFIMNSLNIKKESLNDKNCSLVQT